MSRDRQTEQLLRQFNMTDGPKGTTEAFREGWERIFGKKPCANPAECSACQSETETCYLCGNTGRLADAPCPRGCGDASSSDPR